ncbi:SPASM domain peptide maturase of grasp-with-spasm system [Tenacibaculum sp. 190524A05c]
MKMKNNYFLIYTDCVIVSGVKECLIHDLTRHDIYKLPQGYYTIFQKLKTHKISDIENLMTKEDLSNFKLLMDFLVENELGEYVDDISLFPDMSTEWDSPHQITNAIIDFNESKYDVNDILRQLSLLNCQHVEFRAYSESDYSFISNIITEANKYYLNSIELILKYENENLIDELLSIMRSNYIVERITFYNAPNNKVRKVKRHNESIGYIIATEQNIVSNKSCGIINFKNFNVSGIKEYTEAKNFNSCLNRKISIDTDGLIRNCPSMKKDFGNIKFTSLSEVIENKEFTKLWSITKDSVDVCKTCEFRYICTDCRAFLDKPEYIYSKPLKCGYNPETGQWTDWSTNSLKSQSIKYYELSS